MTILDANILLYAQDMTAPHHKAALKWLNRLFAEPDLIGLPWVTIWAFLRITTNPRLVGQSRDVGEVFKIVRKWLSQPGVLVVQPGVRHLELLEQMVRTGQATGPMASDAVLAALAIENGAVLASTDRDFARFPGLRWVNPLE